MVRHVLVTGGAGFVGSHVVDELIARGLEVRVLDALHSVPHGGEPVYLHPDAEVLIGDVRDADVVERSLAGVDAVCHQASMVGLGVDLGDITRYVSINDGGTAVLLRAMHARRFRGPLVLASSMVVYGEGRYRCAEHEVASPDPRRREDLEAGRFDPVCEACDQPLTPEPVTEDERLDPRNVYAATKVHQEHLCEAYAREMDSPFAALRYHNVYGPRMPTNTPYAGVASIFRTALEHGECPQIFEDGRQLRDFIHVRDVARANAAALVCAARGAFNIASGDRRTIFEMAEALSDVSGSEQSPEVTGKFRLGDVRHIVASPNRAGRELGFTATIGFREGMAEIAAVSPRLPGPVP